MDEMRVAKRCPYCDRRLFDKISLTTGYVEIKCPKCGRVIRVDLAHRLQRPRAAAYGSVPSYGLRHPVPWF